MVEGGLGKTCVPCFSAAHGFINCVNKCSASGSKWPYRRDGDDEMYKGYFSSAEQKRKEETANPSSGSGSTASASIVSSWVFIVSVIVSLFLF
jgi:hypothetical protein